MNRTIITGNDNIVIAKYLDGIDGGRSLDVTGYPLKIIEPVLCY